jgi:pimeloyl-ACP methyl ester carboxylesterase
MSLLNRSDSQISYEVQGNGYPVLLFAPGFLSSRMERWRSNPAKPGMPQDFADPIPVFSPEFKVIAHDVRNAGASRGSVGSKDGWHSYIGDALALLDHLKVTRCHVMGACIGVTFALALAQARPGLVTAMVLQNPIGLGDNGRNRGAIDGEVAHWVDQVKDFPGLKREELEDFGRRMFAGDFLFAVPRDYLASCKIPMLLMPGDDTMHPVEVSAEIVRLAPHTKVVAPWKGGQHKEDAIQAAKDFFVANTPRS